jgi:hypothetical protein
MLRLGGVAEGWRVHAGEHYCQLLPFQYAFDLAVVGVLAVALTALRQWLKAGAGRWGVQEYLLVGCE